MTSVEMYYHIGFRNMCKLTSSYSVAVVDLRSNIDYRTSSYLSIIFG